MSMRVLDIGKFSMSRMEVLHFGLESAFSWLISTTLIDNIELARDIARSQFGEASPEMILQIAAQIAAREVKDELAEITGCLLHPLEIHAK